MVTQEVIRIKKEIISLPGWITVADEKPLPGIRCRKEVKGDYELRTVFDESGTGSSLNVKLTKIHGECPFPITPEISILPEKGQYSVSFMSQRYDETTIGALMQHLDEGIEIAKALMEAYKSR